MSIPSAWTLERIFGQTRSAAATAIRDLNRDDDAWVPSNDRRIKSSSSSARERGTTINDWRRVRPDPARSSPSRWSEQLGDDAPGAIPRVKGDGATVQRGSGRDACREEGCDGERQLPLGAKIRGFWISGANDFQPDVFELTKR